MKNLDSLSLSPLGSEGVCPIPWIFLTLRAGYPRSVARFLNAFRPNSFSSSVNSCQAHLNLAPPVIFITALVVQLLD